ncbi:MAG: hypothetical protein JKY65_17085, partial [Planctomycetes bacterium]|nr:hypothetical protein [Planctomycetota bacterium]
MTKQTHSPEATRRRTLNAVERATPPSARRVLHAFLSWLEGVRLVSASTAYLHIMLVSGRFLPDLLGQETACVRAICRLAPADVEQALERQHELKPHARCRLDYSASQFLLFCVSQGWLTQAFLHDLSSLSFRVPDPYWTPATSCLKRSRAIARIRSRSARRVLTDYADWLEERSLAPSTIELRVSTTITLFGY